MFKKLSIAVLIILALLLGAFLWLKHSLKGSSVEGITLELETAELYETRCNICHGGASPEAPSIESLKLLSQDMITTALSTGVMKNQGMMLTTEQHQALADYISEVDDSELSNQVMKGLCSDSDSTGDLVADPQIDNWGVGYHNMRYHANQVDIDQSNVSQLELAWVFAFPNSSRARVQPTIVGNTLFTASQTGTIYALDRHSGCIRWTYQADEEVRSALVVGRDSMGTARHLYFGDFAAHVYAIDLLTQQLVWKVKIDDHADATITGSLSEYEDRLYIPVSSMEIANAADEQYECCTFRGSMVALNKADGSLAWKTYTIPEEPALQGQNKKGVDRFGPSGAPIWTAVTLDTARRSVYIGTGENYTRPVTPTSDAIISFDMDDGSIQWVQQMYPDDAWNGACVTLTSRANCPEDSGPDADFGAPPILVNHNGREVLLAGQKSGHVYALDPDNEGELLWTNLVGRGGTMGGVHWGMATDGEVLYVPINDRGLYNLNNHKEKSPGLHALDIADGETLWSTIEENRCPPMTLRGCGPGISAAITLVPGVVFGGTLDGYMKAYATDDGRELWSYDTKRDYEAVNEVRAFGGAIDSDGPIIVENQLFITSGYAKFGEKEGNVLLSFQLADN